MKHAEIVIRWLPGHVWVRPFTSWSGDCEPGHAWMYMGLVRRDAWTAGRLGFGVLRMPKASHVPVVADRP